MFTNDPRDIIRKKLKDARGESPPILHHSERPKAASNGGPDVVTEETMPAANPMSSQNFSPMMYIFGSLIAFWTVAVQKMWYWIPVLVGVFYYLFPVEGEAMQQMIGAGATASAALFAALNNALLASIVAVGSTWYLGSRLKNGGVMKRSAIMLVQLPSLLLAMFTFYDIALAIYLYLVL